MDPLEFEHLKRLEFEASAGSNDARSLLISYRERHGLCFICGEQGIIICCRQTRCGLHSLEHLKTKTRWKMWHRDQLENRVIVDSKVDFKAKTPKKARRHPPFAN